MTPAIAPVNCGSCKACCYQLVLLFPEQGDDTTKLRAVSGPPGSGRLALARNPDGSCVYLGEKGCTLWPNHPAVCRVFDCGRFFLRHTAGQRRRMLRAGQWDIGVYNAGRKRARELRA